MLNLNEKNYNCDCGKTHALNSEILLNKGSVDNINLLLKKYYAVARIGIVYDKAVSDIAQDVLQNLLKNGYEVSDICYEALTYPTKADCERLLNLDENVRFFVAIGGGSIATVVRWASFVRGNSYGIVATSPSTDSYLDSNSVFEDKSEQCESAKFVICDENLYQNVPEYLVASGIGCVFNCYLSLFLLEYRKAIYKQKYCITVASDLKSELDYFLKEYEKSNNPQNLLMQTLLKISLARQYLMVLDSSADKIAYLLCESQGSRFYGENLFLSVYVIANMYKLYLDGYCTDTLIPADYVKGIKLLNVRLGADYNFPKERFVGYKQNNILATSFLINEYRQDFLKILNDINVEQFAKIFRRCYKDAGFWLKGYIKASDLLEVSSLAGLINKDSLHSFIKETGFLEEML